MDAILIAVGDELLTGHTINSNSAWIAQRLSEIGVTTRKILMIKDCSEEIIRTLQESEKETSLVVMTGGLGPTKDDVTKSAISTYFGKPMVFSHDMYENILEYFNRIQRTPTESHRKQCYIPQDTVLVPNLLGTAPGMWIEKKNFSLLSLPGVPYEMRHILDNGGLDKIRNMAGEGEIFHLIIQTAGIGETHIEDKIDTLTHQFPPSISIAYLPGVASVKIRISAKGENRARLEKEVFDVAARIEEVLEPFVIGRNERTLNRVIGDLCTQRGIRIAVAESCTGGYISHLITKVPGSSEYFNGGVIAYSNEMKRNLLQVSERTLEIHGAVSEETVKEMVSGLLALTKADLGLAISGIAGPGGGTAEKPVGTVWIAVGKEGRIYTEKVQLAKDRVVNIQYASVFALNLLRLLIESKI